VERRRSRDSPETDSLAERSAGGRVIIGIDADRMINKFAKVAHPEHSMTELSRGTSCRDQGDGVRPNIEPPQNARGADNSYLEARCLRVGVFLFYGEFIVGRRRPNRAQSRVVRVFAISIVPLLAIAVSETYLMAGQPAMTQSNNAGLSASFAESFRPQSDEPTRPPLPTNEAPPTSSNLAAGSPDTTSPDPPGVPASSLVAPGRVTEGFFYTAFESLFGEASTSGWTPLSFYTLFSEGWNQPFVFSPASDSGALRQEWINAANGVFYRQWVLDYNYRDRTTGFRNRDLGTFTIFAPLSRRLELNISIPFVDYHPVENSKASSGGRSAPRLGSASYLYRTTVDDLTITPQVMLSESRNTSIMSLLAIRTPTGSLSAGDGGTTLGPQIQFWQGLPGRCVIRGGAGPTIPLTSTGLHTTFDTNLTLGRFLTLDDVRYFKELTVWIAANNSAAMDHSGAAADTMTILPGIRFRIAKQTWFLYGVEVPLVAPRSEDYGMYFRLVRRW